MFSRRFISIFFLSIVSLTLQADETTHRPIDVQSYKLFLQLNPQLDSDHFQATVEIRLRALTALNAFTLDSEDLEIRKVAAISPIEKPLPFQVIAPHKLQVKYPKGLKTGQEIKFSVTYLGRIHTIQDGLFKVRDPEDPARGVLFFTQFEPLGARRFFPCNDVPYDKALTEITISVPQKYDVVSNGRKISDRSLPRNPGFHEVKWRMEVPHSTYLVSLAVAPFHKLSQVEHGKELSLYISEKKQAKASYALEATAKAFHLFEQTLKVRYPWHKYAQVGIPTFQLGGMENTSSTFMNEERFLLNDPRSEVERVTITSLVSHELAHQWFGDYVTMQWWNDVWLNEAFASYFASFATQHAFSQEESDIDDVLNVWNDYFREDNGPRSHPIVTSLPSPEEAFDPINYDKGEAVLRMLSYQVGANKFMDGVHNYLVAHAYGNATNEDFFQAIEKTSGQSLKDFRESWLLKRGYPLVRYEGEWQPKTSTYKIELSQKPNHDEDKTIYHFRIPIEFHRETAPAYYRRLLVSMDSASAVQRVKLEAEPEWISLNPESEVLAQIAPSHPDMTALSLQALKDPRPLSRMWAQYFLFKDFAEGHSLDAQAEKTLIQVLKGDSSPFVRVALLKGLEKAKSRWLPRELGSALFALAKETAPLRQTAADLHGWKKWHSELLGALGKVDDPQVFAYLSSQLLQPDLPLDDVQSASLGIARLGDERSASIIKNAIKLHEHRGYRYVYLLQYALGAWETPAAADVLKEILATAGPDLLIKLRLAIRDNYTLKSAPEWATTLKDFLLHDKRVSDDVKSQLLESVEEVKTSSVQETLQHLVKESSSQRIRTAAQRILDQNFPS